jgi:GAF domain-containing protein
VSGRPLTDELAELERLRLENETLSGVVGVVASGPDLAHILDRVVDLLTRASDCHACFVYLQSGDRLVLRAASPVYQHLVGRIALAAGEGLVGWVMEQGRAEFIREGGLEDPRTAYVPELEEERFQSMVAVPITSRAATSIGAIVLHTEAPREFDEGIINVLGRAAALVSGAIENARLYEDARERVEELTRLAELSQDLAAVSDRASLLQVGAAGMRRMLGGDLCRIYEVDPEHGARHVAADPPSPEEVGTAAEAELLADLAAHRELTDEVAAKATRSQLGGAIAVPLATGSEWVGAILVASEVPLPDSARELLRTAGHQFGLALEKIALIERLTDENVARDLFEAIVTGEVGIAAARAAAGGIELGRVHLVAVARPRTEPDASWKARSEAIELLLRRLHPGALCDLGSSAVRAILPTPTEGTEAARKSATAIATLARDHNLAIGLSEARTGLAGIRHALEEADDASRIGLHIQTAGDVLLYRDTGVYRYLIEQLESGGPDDHLRDLVEQIDAYDTKRNTQLLLTLDTYLDHSRSAAATARALWIHVNTLRQRLERIESLTSSPLEDQDLLALQLAVKLARLGR